MRGGPAGEGVLVIGGPSSSSSSHAPEKLSCGAGPCWLGCLGAASALLKASHEAKWKRRRRVPRCSPWAGGGGCCSFVRSSSVVSPRLPPCLAPRFSRGSASSHARGGGWGETDLSLNEASASVSLLCTTRLASPAFGWRARKKGIGSDQTWKPCLCFPLP